MSRWHTPSRKGNTPALPSSCGARPFPLHRRRASDRLCLTRQRCETGFVWTVLGSLPGSRRSSCCQQPATQPRGDPTSAPGGPTPGAAVLTPPSWFEEEFRMGFPPATHPSPEGLLLAALGCSWSQQPSLVLTPALPKAEGTTQPQCDLGSL